jgi:hypothetical protein
MLDWERNSRTDSPTRSPAGTSTPPPFPLILPDQLKDRLWHIPFNQLAETNEKLVRGREEIFFGAEFSASAGTNKLPKEAVDYYIQGLSDPDAPHGSFQLYRAFGPTTAQNESAGLGGFQCLCSRWAEPKAPAKALRTR